MAVKSTKDHEKAKVEIRHHVVTEVPTMAILVKEFSNHQYTHFIIIINRDWEHFQKSFEHDFEHNSKDDSNNFPQSN